MAARKDLTQRPCCRRSLCLVVSAILITGWLGASYLLTERVILPALPSASDPAKKPTYPPMPPAKPTGKASQTDINITWVKPDARNASILYYEVQQNSSSVAFKTVANETSTAFHVGNLLGSQNYCFRVRATSSVGPGNFSVPLCLSTLPPGPPDSPNSPTPINTSRSSLAVGWDAPPDHGAPILGYTVQAAEHFFAVEFKFKTVCTLMKAPLARSCNASGLDHDRHYSFRVQATNKVGASNWSSEVEVHTDERDAKVPDQLAAPTIGFAGANYLELTWVSADHDNGAEILGYTVQLLGGGSSGNKLLPFPRDAVSTRIDKLESETNYCVQVAAFNSQGRGTWSGQACKSTTDAQPPGAPQLQPTPVYTSGSVLSVRWSVPDDGGAAIEHYEAQRDDWWTDASFGFTVKATHPTANFTTLMPSIQYKIRVRAVNKAGPGPWSDVHAMVTDQAGQCGNKADAEAYKNTKTTMKPGIQGCLIGCVTSGATCAQDCIEKKLGFSSGCAMCWVVEGECSLKQCIQPCLRPASTKCKQCSEEKCFPACVQCTGVPLFYFPA
eukprot:m.122289 g.122289  ORF g.122289 m.122289 type:complete len:556 (-) comp16557_c1_seq1:88-1755(-)